MRRLGQQEQLVDRADVDVLDSAKVDPHAEVAQQEHDLFTGEQSRGAQEAQCATDFVIERNRAIVEQRSAGVVLVVDDLGNHQVLEVADDVFFALAERRLVGNLVEVAGRFGAFAVEPAYGEAHILGGAEDLFDLARQLQGRQVKHDAHADARAYICRTRRQVPKTRVKREIELSFQAVVDAVDLIPGLFKLKPAAQHLDAQVVFLVDHDRKCFAFTNGNAARALRGGVLLADQVPLDQELAVHLRGGFEIDIKSFGGKLGVKDGLADFVLGGLPLVAGHAGQEALSCEIARQSNPRRDDDFTHRAAAPKPLARSTGQIA